MNNNSTPWYNIESREDRLLRQQAKQIRNLEYASRHNCTSDIADLILNHGRIDLERKLDIARWNERFAEGEKIALENRQKSEKIAKNAPKSMTVNEKMQQLLSMVRK